MDYKLGIRVSILNNEHPKSLMCHVSILQRRTLRAVNSAQLVEQATASYDIDFVSAG
ncbi:MAG TPA: hypothetical protein VFP00_03980 [Burkholderiales bacterium]|nr:hypothetical protein [Burkholderiales bacterium]